MKKILMPTAEAVVAVNRFVCQQGGNPHHCYDPGKIESAIHSAFYPGSYPFAHGGIPRLAGALCYYIVQSHAFVDGNKRTGALAAIAFLNQHGPELKYPMNKKEGMNALADTIEKCASSKLSKDQLMDWFESHSVRL